MLNDISFFNNNAKMDMAVADATSIFGEDTPYTKVELLASTQIIFKPHFEGCVRQAMSTGCIARMSEPELVLFREFMVWQQWLTDHSVTAGSAEDTYMSPSNQKDALLELNNWMYRELTCEAQPVLNACYDEVWVNTPCVAP